MAKRMNRKSAFEFLRDTKVLVSPEQSQQIQEIAMAAGYSYYQSGKGPIKFRETVSLYFTGRTYRIGYMTDLDYYYNENCHREVMPEDILDIEIEDK